MRSRHRALWMVLLILALAASALAQETASDPDIPVEELALRVKPLTVNELQTEADAWLDVVRARARATVDAQLEGRGTEGAAKDARLLEVTKRREARTAAIDRLNTVLRDLEAKGGDVAAYRNYVAAVSGLHLAGEETVGTLTAWLKSDEGGLRWGRNVGLFLAVLVAFWIVATVLSAIVARTLRATRLHVSEMLQRFFVNATRNVVFLVGIVVALTMLEIDVGPILAAMGVAGFVVGFALQDTLGNFAAGLMILLYRPYDIGNLVEVGGVTGKVAAMSLVSTTLRTPDNQAMIVPNGRIWGGVIRNVTGATTRRVDLVFGIGYSDDIGRAQGILEEILAEHDKVLAEPRPVVRVHQLGESSVDFVCRPWCKTDDYWDVHWDVTRAVKERFDAEGISIPFPQRDVHLHRPDEEAPSEPV